MQVPARVSIILASSADYAVILRRGPTSQVATLGWDLQHNTLTMGQWLKGRILSCHLSPNGKSMIYFAYSDKSGSTWITVSKAPLLKALDFYQTDSSWEATCFFLTNDEYWVGQSVLDKIQSNQFKTFKHSHFKVVTDREISRSPYPWQYLVTEEITLSNGFKYRMTSSYKQILTDQWLLIKTNQDQYSLLHNESNQTIELPTWYSATRYKNRILFSENGQLKSLDIAKLNRENPLSHAVTLHDLNDMQFEEIIAPY